MAVLGVAVVGFAVQQTAVVPAIQDVQRSLHASAEWSAWLVTVYLIVATVATLAMGRLADLHGRRRMLLIGLGVFATASVGAALSPNIVVLIVFRALQGIGGSVYPLTLAIAREQVPARRTTVTISLLTAAFGVGTAVGFVAGGYLAEYATWRAIFGLGAVLVATGMVLARRGLGATVDKAQGRFDTSGTVVLGVSVVGLLAALTVAVSLGWESLLTLGLLSAALVFGLGWVYVERRAIDPLIDLRVLRNPAVAATNLATVGLGWTLFSSFLLIPQFARASTQHQGYGLGVGSSLVGVLMLPLAIGQTIGALGAGRLLARVAPRQVFAGGLVVVAAAAAVLSINRSSVALTAVGAFLFGAGAGMGLQSGSSVVTEGVAPEVAAVSASLNSTVRRLAGGIGGQVSTILLATIVIAGEPAFAAYLTSYAIGGGLCLVGAAVVLFAPRPS